MDWERIRQQWQHDVMAAPDVSVDTLQSLDAALQKKVRMRDLIETVAAIIVAVFFGIVAVAAAVQGQWAVLFFALLLVVWAVWVPFRLRHARRRLPEAGRHLPLLESLSRQRDAALAQARMLEQVWLWYLTPPAIGIVGMKLAFDGPGTGTMIYIGVILAFYAGLAWLNRHAARTQFRAHAERLQCQIDALTVENGA